MIKHSEYLKLIKEEVGKMYRSHWIHIDPDPAWSIYLNFHPHEVVSRPQSLSGCKLLIFI